jgi:hypothetical protein
LVAFALAVLRGELLPTAGQMAALAWLADRGFGRTVPGPDLQADLAESEAADSPRLDLSAMPTADLVALRNLLEAASASSEQADP